MTTKTRHPQELSDVLITDEFFVPFTSIYEDRERCRVFLGVWKEFASEIPRTPWFDVPVPRILHAIGECRPKDAQVTARIVASLIAWFGTNIGYCFFQKLFAGINRSELHWQTSDNVHLALSLWSLENSFYMARMLHRPRLLQIILQSKENRAPLTALQMDAAESFMTYLATSDDGHALLVKLELAARSLSKAR